MGRGKGGYTEKQTSYRDSGGHKVTDSGAIFVGERYIDMGFMTVFRQEHPDQKNYDLTIKTSDDTEFVKNIEVKQVTSKNPSKVASNIKKAFRQVGDGGTVAIYLPNHTKCNSAISFVTKGFKEAQRKGFVKGPVEVWFNDKKNICFE